jgi:hypothetical protein
VQWEKALQALWGATGINAVVPWLMAENVAGGCAYRGGEGVWKGWLANRETAIKNAQRQAFNIINRYH